MKIPCFEEYKPNPYTSIESLPKTAELGYSGFEGPKKIHYRRKNHYGPEWLFPSMAIGLGKPYAS